ncbi:MAG: chemotaxis protein CheV [SAR324 cluster bacterium]|nr:chemotaxis protein CheV [SAR324 cluster bacterium]MBF0350702.1 chemotaxis protein CheV [SAR324 cluster bacterium]
MTEILLESGTNELEIVEFYIHNVRYGVNVTKVEEVRYLPKYRKIPQTSPIILGFFNLRGKVMPIIDLPQVMGAPSISQDHAQVIVMHFNRRVVGFLVERVVKIIRLSWENIISPPCSFENQQVVGVIIEPGRERDLIQLIDFEKIMEEITPSFHDIEDLVEEIPPGSFDRSQKKIWIAEDSKMIQKVVAEGLGLSGYSNQRWFNNGAETWDALNAIPEDKVFDEIELLVSDIEMPQMDGLHLVKLMKSTPRLQKIPVIMFSSLINDSTIHKCMEVGADAQTAKPGVDELIILMDDFLQRISSPTD